MSKNNDSHRDDKKKPKLTLMEKRQRKHEKKEAKEHRISDVQQASQPF